MPRSHLCETIGHLRPSNLMMSTESCATPLSNVHGRVLNAPVSYFDIRNCQNQILKGCPFKSTFPFQTTFSVSLPQLTVRYSWIPKLALQKYMV
ncbi:hypothetical protein Mapa_013121 [Marchantia paleacea]|nr:hypothetical protein Mapa_013121 [Marchantia paleacea]